MFNIKRNMNFNNLLRILLNLEFPGQGTLKFRFLSHSVTFSVRSFPCTIFEIFLSFNNAATFFSCQDHLSAS